MNFRLETQRKSPEIMSVIIDYNEVKFVTRWADNGQTPKITKNKLKGGSANRGRSSKR
jgi:hypothetical protein